LLYSVQIRLDSGEMVVRMGEMRQWLDSNGFEPDAFEYRRMDANGVVYRVDFNSPLTKSDLADSV
jgi:hypothetical protein